MTFSGNDLLNYFPSNFHFCHSLGVRLYSMITGPWWPKETQTSQNRVIYLNGLINKCTILCLLPYLCIDQKRQRSKMSSLGATGQHHNISHIQFFNSNDVCSTHSCSWGTKTVTNCFIVSLTLTFAFHNLIEALAPFWKMAVKFSSSCYLPFCQRPSFRFQVTTEVGSHCHMWQEFRVHNLDIYFFLRSQKLKKDGTVGGTLIWTRPLILLNHTRRRPFVIVCPLVLVGRTMVKFLYSLMRHS